MSILETGAKYKKRIEGTHDNELMDTCYSAPFAHSSNGVLYCGGLKYGNEWPKFTTAKTQNEAVQFFKKHFRTKTFKLTWPKQANINKCAFPEDY